MDMLKRDDDDDLLVGNRAIAEFATAEGYKISTSSVQKATSPAINTGPKLVGYLGKRPTSTKGLVRAWNRSRMRPVRQAVQAASAAPTAMSVADTSPV
jgi:hypothetical protein